MSDWHVVREFRTKRFRVVLDCEPERDPDLSWAEDDAETRDKLERGIYVNVTFRVRVLCDGREIGADYLGNSVYENIEDFAREHIGIRSKSRADGCNYGSYFPDMLATAIAESRKTLCNAPRVRC